MPSSTEIISGTTQVNGQAPLVVTDKSSAACPKLDSQLNQVVSASDPLSTAEKLNLMVKEGKVQVVIILASQKIDFLLEYAVEPGSQAGDELQAYAAPSQLCEISNRDEVLAIRSAAASFTP